jgi:ankyrin repeat protein
MPSSAMAGTDAHALLREAAAGNLPRVQRLLSEGASVTVADSQGRTCLHFAAMHGEIQMVQW